MTAAALACAFASIAPAAATPVAMQDATADVYFSTQDDIGEKVIDFIGVAKRRVWLAGYYFTHAGIAKALAQAKERGVDVRVVLDSSQATAQYSGATYLADHKIPVWIDSSHAIMHAKTIVRDDDGVAFGSANFTKAAMDARSGNPHRTNTENFNLFSRAPALNKQYAAEFLRRVAESTPYVDRR